MAANAPSHAVGETSDRRANASSGRLLAGLLRACARTNGLRVLLILLVMLFTAANARGVAPSDLLVRVGTLGAMGGALVAAEWMLSRRRSVPVGLALALGDLVLAAFGAALAGGAWSSATILFALPVLQAGLTCWRPGGAIVGAAAAVALAVLTAVPSTTPPTAQEGLSSGGRATSVPILLEGAALMVIGVFAGRLREVSDAQDRELVRARQQLRRARLEAGTIIENMSSGLITVAKEGRVQHMNRAASVILGVRAQDVRGKDYRSVFVGDLSPLARRLERALLFGLAESRGEVCIVRDGSTVPVGISTTLLRDADGQVSGALAVFQDLTLVREQEEAARRQETLATIGGLTAGIVHEIRNCLHPLSGSIEELRRDLAPTGSNAVLMELISTECERLNRFIGALLSYGRHKALVLDGLDLHAFLLSVVEEVRHHAAMREGLSLLTELDTAPICVRADREALRQVMVNLLVNGMEATPDQGAIVIRTALDASAQTVTIMVEDNGVGIASGDLARVSEAFFTTKNAGTGLGLAIASQIVERHGGHLAVTSTEGVGTTVHVTLPAESVREIAARSEVARDVA
jgi:PAS domain S-box-containing protein